MMKTKSRLLYIVLFLCNLSLSAEETSPSCILSADQSREEYGVGLSQCLQMAQENNRTLQNAALEILSSTELQKEAYTKYYPQISANVTAFQAFSKIIKGDGSLPETLKDMPEPFSSFAGMPLSISELNRGYGVTLSAIEPIYAGGQIHNGNKLAAINNDVCKLQLQMKEKDVLQKVTENYWQIATIRYNLRTLDAADKEIDTVMAQVQRFVDAGVTTRNALLQVKLRKQELASNRLKLENAEHILLMLLAQQVGAAQQTSDGCKSQDKSSSFDIVTPDEVVPTELPIETDVYTAANNREELQMATKGVEAQKLQIKMERGKLLPTVAVGVMGYNLGLGGLSDNVTQYLNTNMTNGLALGTVSIPLSAWWGGSHAIKRQKLKLKQAENNRQDALEMLAIDIESSWSNLMEAFKQIDIAKASVESSEENLRMYSNQYKSGTVTITDLLDAETLNRKSHNQLSQACADYQVKLADYQRKTR